MSLRTEHPLPYAVGFLMGAVVADLFLIGGEVLAWVINWRHGRQL
jgi:hypothetical protein